jgi:hypothetical protein
MTERVPKDERKLHGHRQLEERAAPRVAGQSRTPLALPVMVDIICVQLGPHRMRAH